MNILKNPTPNANYLIDERIIFGWYPGADNLGLLSNSIDALIATDRNVFVNLTMNIEKNTLFNYTDIVTAKVKDPIFIHYSIDDCGLPKDIDSYHELINLLHFLIKQNRKLYIHCRGGHGRSGLVSACLLIHMGYTNNEALDLVSKAHKTRDYIPDYPCPQTEEQVLFVKKYHE